MSAARKVAVLKGGGSLERTVSLRSGAQVQQALSRLGHEVIAIDAGPSSSRELHECEPDAAFVALHGGDGEDGTVQGLLEAIGVPYTGSGPAACMRCTDKALAKYLMREAGIPTPEFHADQGDRDQRARRRRARSATSSARSGSRWSSSRPARARRWASSSRAPATSCPRRSSARSPTTARSCSSATSRAATWPCRCSTPAPIDGAPLALPVVEAVPREEDFYDYESRYEIGMTTFVCPAELPADTTQRARELALERTRCSAATASRASI